MTALQRLCNRIAEDGHFQGAILALLVANAFAIGLEFSPAADTYADALGEFYLASQAIFVGEILIRLCAYLPRVQDYFRDGWNSFDFVVVTASLVPDIAGLAMPARLLRFLRFLRLLRIARIVSAVARLRRKEP